ncbi:MAG: 4-hydroxy-tetrahydrodipicolinate synthase [Deltaproteobacteria bacterium]|nr:4-hydroxy-tetrahydrodipicolinate synthase [Deltaproteobacteria bacterium]MCB9490307.1 4-hydroxy-tetrahydrodipicolinate synthase [Deltaproteobacteria bacterium]
MQFSGIITALATPFKDGQLDLDAVERLVEHQIDNGVHGLVSCGCTGEAATMTMGEDRRLWKTVMDVAKKRVPVIAGAGSNDTQAAVKHVKEAEEDGADAVMCITPYYNKPTQEGLYQHYKAIAEGTKLPVILYNVPGRTACDMQPETVARLSEIPNIVAVKEASGTVHHSVWALKLSQPDFTVLSGDDPMYLPLAPMGVKGVISVASNVVPRQMADMHEKAAAGDYAGATKIYMDLLPLYKALFVETNPIPVKCALKLLGLAEDEVRLPLTTATAATVENMRKVLTDLGMLS